MTAENIFEVPQDDVVTIDETVDYFESLVGEGKKFKTPQELAKGKALADQTVEVLKAKLDALNAELNTRTSLDKFLEEIKGQKKDGNESNPPVVPQNPDPQAPNLEEQLEAILSKRENAKKSESNIALVTRTLKEQFGDKASQLIDHKARELEMSRKDLETLAHRSPTAFFSLVGVSGSRPQAGAPAAQNRFNSFQQEETVRGHSYYEKLKRENPKKYFDKNTTVEMIRDMGKIGREKYYQS